METGTTSCERSSWKDKNHIDTLERYTSAAMKDVVQIRKHFWDDVTVNVDNTEEAIETAASIKQQAELLSEREQSHRHAYQKLKGLQRLQQSPYFGRIDFLEDGEKVKMLFILVFTHSTMKIQNNFLYTIGEPLYQVCIMTIL